MTTNTNNSSRFGWSAELTTDGVECLPYGSLLPDDFTDRLQRLKEASSLTWSGFAAATGVDCKQMYRWHNEGVEPSGGAMHSLFLFASRMPEGLDILMGEGFQMTFFKD